jgi:hypothetical protein
LFEKIKVFLKNQKHEPNIVELTHLCIMHKVHTSFGTKPTKDFFPKKGPKVAIFQGKKFEVIILKQ